MEVGVVMHLSWSSTLNHGYLKTSARFAKEMGGVHAIYTGVHVIEQGGEGTYRRQLAPRDVCRRRLQGLLVKRKNSGNPRGHGQWVKGTVMLKSSSVKPTEAPAELCLQSHIQPQPPQV